MLLTILVAAFAAEPVKPAEPAARMSIVSKPDWIEKPSGSDVNLYYPARAAAENKGGSIKLRCEVLATGYLTGCRVESEDPPGYDFGAAALSLSSKFRMRPQTADGMPVGGATVLIPIKFTPAESGRISDLPRLDLSLACYGHFSARAEANPTDGDIRGNATIFGMAVLLGANQAGWSPSKVEAAMTSARKSADPAKAPEECPMVPGAGEQLRKSGL